MILIMGLLLGLWLGYKSGYYILELYEKNTISLNEIAGLILCIIVFPVSIIIATDMFFEANGNKILITRKKEGGYNPPPKNPPLRQKPTPMPPPKMK